MPQALHPPHARRHDEAVFEGDALPEPAQLAAAGRSVHLHVIDALDLASGVHEPVGQSTVVGEEQEPAALEIEPADRIEPLAEVGHERAYGEPALRIGERADDAAGLVERDGPPRGPAPEALSIHGDLVALRVGARAELVDHLAVDADASGPDQLLGVTSGRHAEGAEDLLQPLAQPSCPPPASPAASPASGEGVSARATSASAPSARSPSGGSAFRSGRPKTSRKSFVVP